MIKNSFWILILTFFFGCQGDAFYKELPNRYFLHALEHNDDLNLGRITDTINGWGEAIICSKIVYCAMDDSMFYVIHRNQSNHKLVIGETYYYTLPIYGKDSVFDYWMPTKKSLFDSSLYSADRLKLVTLYDDFYINHF